MKTILKAIVPPTRKAGSCVIVGTCSMYETYKQNILWAYNRMLEHDGYEPVKKMPRGTKYKRTLGFGF